MLLPEPAVAFASKLSLVTLFPITRVSDHAWPVLLLGGHGGVEAVRGGVVGANGRCGRRRGSLRGWRKRRDRSDGPGRARGFTEAHGELAADAPALNPFPCPGGLRGEGVARGSAQREARGRLLGKGEVVRRSLFVPRCFFSCLYVFSTQVPSPRSLLCLGWGHVMT